MADTRRMGLSYTRFSDGPQAKGDSQDRQDRMFKQFCERHDLTPVSEVFADRGLSGYKDEHRKRGRLGQLVAVARDGGFERGTVVVIEAWDRLGRLRPDKMTALVAELVQAGLGIGVCRLDDIFTEEDFGTHKWTTLAVFIQLAYQESKQKADRLASSWQARREQARGGAGPVNDQRDGHLRLGLLPAWLERAGGGVRVIRERAAAVRRLLGLAADGLSVRRIILALTAEGVPAFRDRRPRDGGGRPRFAGRWAKSYVHLLLNDRRLIGEFQPARADGTPDGPPLSGYYPAAVPEPLFLAAREAQADRAGVDARGRRVGPRQSRYVNVFRGLLRDARDGGGWHLHNKGTAAAPRLVLVAAAYGDGGGWVGFPYRVFEDEILDRLREVDPAAVLPRPAAAAGRLDALRGALVAVREDVAALKADLARGYSKAVADVLRSREAEEVRAAEAVQRELARAARPAERAWAALPGLVEVVRRGGDDARLKLRPVLRRVVDEVRVLVAWRGSYHCLVAAQVLFHGGRARSYLIAHRRACKWRPADTQSYDFADVLGDGDLDLRRPEHARALADDLAATTPEEVTALAAAPAAPSVPAKILRKNRRP